jgi:hypothetical protein
MSQQNGGIVFPDPRNCKSQNALPARCIDITPPLSYINNLIFPG